MSEYTERQVIERNAAEVRQRMAAAAARGGRKAGDIAVVAVTKTYPIEYILAARDAGLTIIGENKVQEAKEKAALLTARDPKWKTTWHLVGHLQTNKARQAVEIFDMIHSVDSFRLAAEIDRRAYTRDKIMPILIEVNTSREKSKYGIDPDDVLETVKKIAELKNVAIKGLMTIGGLTAATAGDADRTRSYFRRLRELRDFVAEQKIPQVDMSVLSMGMSGDFEIAIEEGSTMVRIGTAIFGKRKRGAQSFSMENPNPPVEEKP